MAAVATAGFLALAAATALGSVGAAPAHRADGDAAASPDRRSAPSDPQVVDELLAAWERSRTATYVVVTSFTRTMADGRTLQLGQVRTAQRPPDRLVASAESVEGRRDDLRFACAPDASDEWRCRTVPAASRDTAEAVRRERRLLRTAVAGAGAPYRVEPTPPSREGATCFRMVLRAPMPGPPYGRETLLCFDDATGAPVLRRVVREEATDLLVAVEVRATVRDADLAPPAPVRGARDLAGAGDGSAR